MTVKIARMQSGEDVIADIKEVRESPEATKALAYDFVDALGWNMEVVYNVGDAVNKIGFGLVIYNLAVTDK